MNDHRLLPDDPKLMALLDNAVQGAQRGTILTNGSGPGLQTSNLTSRLQGGEQPGPAGPAQG